MPAAPFSESTGGGDSPATVRRVLSHYAVAGPHTLHPLGSAGGFSGARFWQVRRSESTLCLRRWPTTHPNADRLAWIHAVLRHVAGQGCPWIPTPLPTTQGETFVRHDGHLWELTPWLGGTADDRRSPSPERLQAAMVALGHFHRAAATFVQPEPPTTAEAAAPPTGPGAALPGRPAEATWIAGGAKRGPSPGLRQRRNLLQLWLDGDLDRLAAALAAASGPDFRSIESELRDRGMQLIACCRQQGPDLLRQLAATSKVIVPLQPCIRDIWRDHVLFEGNQVSGLVDFGAMRVESVCGDLARLLGSLAGDQESDWRLGLEVYERVRPLDESERRLVSLFDRSGTLLGGLNWLRWTYWERRQFDWPRVLARLDETLQRLRYQATREIRESGGK